MEVVGNQERIILVSHSVLKSVLLDKKWASRWGCTCFSGDSDPFYLSSKCVYRPDVVWQTRNGLLYVVEIPLTEGARAVVGEFFLACGIKSIRRFDVMINEGPKSWCVARLVSD